jgi:ribosomal protein S18 acetylase RimI-like enzyme
LWRSASALPTVTDNVAALESLLDRDGDSLIVACCGDEVVGSLIATWDGWRGNMYRLAVHPSFRRRGLARALVADGEKRLRARGCKRITALVIENEEHAVEFWTGAGYSFQPGMDRFRKNLDD